MKIYCLFITRWTSRKVHQIRKRRREDLIELNYYTDQNKYPGRDRTSPKVRTFDRKWERVRYQLYNLEHIAKCSLSTILFFILKICFMNKS